ncbi:hypothetical protein [Clostridium sp.]|uniref:hypothetical protein n=1 Tax=Clostridium sp. TaxID=1506 RepID=UPI003216498A
MKKYERGCILVGKYRKFVSKFLVSLFTLMIFGTNMAFAISEVDSAQNEITPYVIVNPNCPYYTKHHGKMSGIGWVKCSSLSGQRDVTLYQCDCGAQMICTGYLAPHLPTGLIGYYTSNFVTKLSWDQATYFECGSMSYSGARSLPTWEFYP